MAKKAAEPPLWKQALVVAAIIAAIGGIIVAAINHFPQAAPAPATATGNATTSGPNSPANTGSGNTFNIGDTAKKGK